MPNLESMLNFRLPAAPATTNPELHKELLVIYNALNSMVADLGETHAVENHATSPISLTHGIFTKMLSMTLPAGAWVLDAMVNFLPTTTTNITLVVASTVTDAEYAAAFQVQNVRFQHVWNPGVVSSTGASIAHAIPSRVIHITEPTVINVAVAGNFSVSTLKAFGYLFARRVIW